MKKLVSLIVASFILAGTTFNLFAADAPVAESQITKANSLDELLTIVKKARTAESALNKRRINEFRSANSRQKTLLNNAIAEEKRQERRTEELKAQYDANELKLAKMDDLLKLKSANLGEMFGVVRQVSLDTSSRVVGSIISAQYPGREVNCLFFSACVDLFFVGFNAAAIIIFNLIGFKNLTILFRV